MLWIRRGTGKGCQLPTFSTHGTFWCYSKEAQSTGKAMWQPLGSESFLLKYSKTLCFDTHCLATQFILPQSVCVVCVCTCAHTHIHKPQTHAQKESKKKFYQPLRGYYKCIFLCLRHINKRDYKTRSESKQESLPTIERRGQGRGDCFLYSHLISWPFPCWENLSAAAAARMWSSCIKHEGDPHSMHCGLGVGRGGQACDILQHGNACGQSPGDYLLLAQENH